MKLKVSVSLHFFTRFCREYMYCILCVRSEYGNRNGNEISLSKQQFPMHVSFFQLEGDQLEAEVYIQNKVQLVSCLKGKEKHPNELVLCFK